MPQMKLSLTSLSAMPSATTASPAQYMWLFQASVPGSIAASAEIFAHARGQQSKPLLDVGVLIRTFPVAVADLEVCDAVPLSIQFCR